MFSGETTSLDGKLELLTVLALLDKLIDLTETGGGDAAPDNPANENAEGANG